MHPDVFARLATFHAEHEDFPDPAILVFDREIQFYLACRDYVERFRRAGLSFCYPSVGGDGKETSSRDAFDLALAETLLAEDRAVTGNDFELAGAERILVVTGPNQGGKTSFARAFGQMHYLASLGCPVPGREARLPLCDRIFTHFEREEDVADLSGKLKDDLTRIHAVLDRATPRSLVVVNEIFSSTTLRDATVLSRRIAERLLQRDLLCVWVTFIEELATLGEQTVSMAVAVDPDKPTERTYRIVRRPADGLAYALSIAEKHRLTREAIERRFKS
jgi:DNA mismatch repair ATPase MutS